MFFLRGVHLLLKKLIVTYAQLVYGWTPDRWKKQSELIKSWKPWKQSKGARTIEGKNPGKNRIRIALVAPEKDCIEAAQRIKTFVQSL